MRYALILIAFVGTLAVACGGGTSREETIRNLQWEVLEPNDGTAVGLMGDIWTVGVRAEESDEKYVVVTRVTAPDKAAYETEQLVNGGEWAESAFPLDFPGASNDLPGAYAVEFEVEGIQVGRDSFTTMPPEPSNDDISVTVDDPFFGSDGSTHFTAQVRNDAEYHDAVDIVVAIRLEDGSGFLLAEPEMLVGDLAPGETRIVNFAAVGPDVAWEFFTPNIRWEWLSPYEASGEDRDGGT